MVPSSGIVTWIVREHLEQQPLHLDVGLVDLVDEQHGRLVAPDGREQRPGQQELLGEDVVVGLLPGGVTAPGLDPQQLLLVVPLVERPRLVEPLVALQAHQVRARRAGDRLGQLGLADAGRPLHQQRLLERAGEEGGRRGGPVGEVAGLGEPARGVVGRGEPGHPASIGRCVGSLPPWSSPPPSPRSGNANWPASAPGRWCCEAAASTSTSAASSATAGRPRSRPSCWSRPRWPWPTGGSAGTPSSRRGRSTSRWATGCSPPGRCRCSCRCTSSPS